MENVTLLLCVGYWRLVLIFGKKKWGLRGCCCGVSRGLGCCWLLVIGWRRGVLVGRWQVGT